MVLLHPCIPGEDVGVAHQSLVAHLAIGCARGAGASAQVGLHVAQGDRQHGVGISFDDAERRGGELGDRRRRAGRDFQRKACGVGEPAAGVILQFARQDDAVRSVLGERLRERDLGDFGGLVVLVEDRRERFAARRRETRLCGERARHRRRETDAHRPDRQAGRRGPLALTRELGREGRPHVIAKALLDRGDDARIGGGGDALAPDEARRGVVGQRPLATRDEHARGTRLVDSAGLQDLLAHVADDDAQRQSLADALDLAPGVGGNARLDCRPAQAQQEMLVFLDIAVAARLHQDDGRAAGREGEFGRAGQRRSLRRSDGARGDIGRSRLGLPVGPELCHATRARRQRLRKVVEPDPIARPAAGAGRHGALAGDRERIGEARVAESDDRLRKLHRDLAHLRDFALRGSGDDARGLGQRGQQQGRPTGCETNAVLVHSGLPRPRATGSLRGRDDAKKKRTSSLCEETVRARGAPAKRGGACVSARGALILLDLQPLRLDIAQPRIDHRGVDEIDRTAAARQALAGAKPVDRPEQVAHRVAGLGFGAQ